MVMRFIGQMDLELTGRILWHELQNAGLNHREVFDICDRFTAIEKVLNSSHIGTTEQGEDHA